VRATYVRLRIKNVGRATARHCSARLIKIERQNQKGSYTELPYTDTLDMAWSNKANTSLASLTFLPVAAIILTLCLLLMEATNYI